MKPCPLHKRRLCNVCGQCHQCYPQLGPEAHDPRTLAAIRRGLAITATLLFLAVAAQAQISYGVAINADSVWSAIFGKS